MALASYVEIPSFEIMKQLARLGLGVALMAPWVATKELAEGSLVMRLPQDQPSTGTGWSSIRETAGSANSSKRSSAYAE